jgi:TPR repeat protein
MLISPPVFHGIDQIKRDCPVASGMYTVSAVHAINSAAESSLRHIDRQPLSMGTNSHVDKSNWEEDEVIEAERYHAESGDLHAQAFMGDLHQNGLRNAPVDHALAARYYGAAAAQGIPEARLVLAKMHILGQVTMDNATVIRYINETMDRHPDAVGLMAQLKALGLAGVQPNEGEALELYKRATAMPNANGNVRTRLLCVFQFSLVNTALHQRCHYVTSPH